MIHDVQVTPAQMAAGPAKSPTPTRVSATAHSALFGWARVGLQCLDTYGGFPPAGSCTNGAITASQYFPTEDFLAPGASA